MTGEPGEVPKDQVFNKNLESTEPGLYVCTGAQHRSIAETHPTTLSKRFVYILLIMGVRAGRGIAQSPFLSFGLNLWTG